MLFMVRPSCSATPCRATDREPQRAPDGVQKPNAQDTFYTGMTGTEAMFSVVAVLDELMSVTRRRTRDDYEESPCIARNRPCTGVAKMFNDMRAKLVMAILAAASVPHIAAGQGQ